MCPLAGSRREQGDRRRLSAAEMAAGALAAALPPCSALQPVTELRCWPCSPGLKHHRIQCLPGINLPVKHFQDSSFQVLLSSCCRTRWGRDRISNSLWQGLFNKSILAQRRHCLCRVAGLSVCVRARVCVPALLEHVCMALRRKSKSCRSSKVVLNTSLALEGVPVLHSGPCHAAGQVAVADCPTEDGITAAFSAQTNQAAESRNTLAAGSGRRMRPDSSRLLAGGGCAAP